ncbi:MULTISPECIES: c-type cytochrome [unclassified Variovorax]|uniref:c-type cytochrome n=1 Tax=unclassified Variovorax TaxID=663243 RepID=UPI001BD225DE|nr:MULTISPECIES: c-type cytochrome [unclassified Variovorax]
MMTKKHLPSVAALLLASACTVALAESAASAKAPTSQLQRGRYLVQTAGCNDCHTPGYAPQNGKVDEKLWLTGDALGWAGPWGTTYPTNLRLLLAGMSEQQWLQHARRMEPRPPMPWFNVRAMTDTDLKAIYAYTRSLGSAGVAAPAYLPPGTKANGPVVQFP